MSEAKVLSDAPWLRSGPAARALSLLNGRGEEARVVGGAVRNALLDIPTGDIDIATTALPEEVARRARAAAPQASERPRTSPKLCSASDSSASESVAKP